MEKATGSRGFVHRLLQFRADRGDVTGDNREPDAD